MNKNVNTRLVIDPITRIIAPKYRNQKAVYVAKGDHNSVFINFEMPRYVDGFDMSAEENIIEIHYVNMSAEDETRVSRGFSDAVDIKAEGNNVIFSWLIPNTATRYAGVVSIGITFERYDTVDGKAQEVYSWSTAPYGKTIVWNSLDNTAEVTEREYDYLVATCNAIVSKALGDVITTASEYVESAKNSANKAEQSERNVSEAEQSIREYAEATQIYATQAGQSSRSAEEAKDEATRQTELARGYVDAINLNLFGNALKGTSGGVNAVRIDDVSPILHTFDNTLSAVNLIDQEAFFSTKPFTITGEVGKTYVIGCTFKSGVTSGGYIADVDASGGLITMGFYEGITEFSITIAEGHTYTWNVDGVNASDIYESVSMMLSDVNEVGVKAYGKNILNYNHTDWQMLDSNNYIIPLNLPQTTLTLSGKFKNISEGYIFIYKSNDNWATQDFVAKQKGIIANLSVYDVTFDVEPNAEYRLWTNRITYNKLSDLLEGIQIEVGGTVTAYEDFIEPVEGAVAVYPTTTLVADTKGVEITAEYSRDINKAFAKLESAIANL